MFRRIVNKLIQPTFFMIYIYIMVFLGLDKKGCETPCLKDPFCDSAVVDVAILTQNVQQIVQNDFDIIELDIMDITCDLFKCIFYSMVQ